MIVLFSDYGWRDPYVGQVKAVLAERASGVPVIDLLHDAPVFNVLAGAHLLAALAVQFPVGSVFFGVVDPGVGTVRGAVAVEADGRWFVGPDNGLFSVVVGRAKTVRSYRIHWQPERCSNTFHGRDLFAPVCARLATGEDLSGFLTPLETLIVPFDNADWPGVIYIDHYGNVWTGLREGTMEPHDVLCVGPHRLVYARTFAEASPDQPFWHLNSQGLVEIATNRGSAAALLGLSIDDRISVPLSRSVAH